MGKWMVGGVLALALAGCGTTEASREPAPETSLTPADKVVFTIDIPMDNRSEGETGHEVIRYILADSGTATNMRDVYDWAIEDVHWTQLTGEDLQIARNIVHLLPAGTGSVMRNRSVVVTEHMAEGNKQRVFDREKLPGQMKDLFTLLGGIRFEVKDEVQFAPEPGDPAERRKNLWLLDLSNKNVTSTDLAYLKDLTKLRWLNLRLTNVTDADLVNLKELKQLRTLKLYQTAVTDTGLANLKELNGLQTLDLSNTRVTDAGLSNLQEMKGLQQLNLSRTGVTDRGLARLKGLNDLRWLDLSGTPITDAGLAQLKEMKSLMSLNLQFTKVTDAGLADLESALPNTKIRK